jgi:hypothetical protein
LSTTKSDKSENIENNKEEKTNNPPEIVQPKPFQNETPDKKTVEVPKKENNIKDNNDNNKLDGSKGKYIKKKL